MKKALLSLSLLGSMSLLGSIGLAAPAFAADLPSTAPPPAVPIIGQFFPAVILQIGPTTPYSTINCSEFVKLPEGPWKAIGTTPFGLGFVQGILPPARPIKSGGYIYNNIDLWSQLEEQCTGALVKARY